MIISLLLKYEELISFSFQKNVLSFIVILMLSLVNYVKDLEKERSEIDAEKFPHTTRLLEDAIEAAKERLLEEKKFQDSTFVPLEKTDEFISNRESKFDTNLQNEKLEREIDETQVDDHRSENSEKIKSRDEDGTRTKFSRNFVKDDETMNRLEDGSFGEGAPKEWLSIGGVEGMKRTSSFSSFKREKGNEDASETVEFARINPGPRSNAKTFLIKSLSHDRGLNLVRERDQDQDHSLTSKDLDQDQDQIQNKNKQLTIQDRYRDESTSFHKDAIWSLDPATRTRGAFLPFVPNRIFTETEPKRNFTENEPNRNFTENEPNHPLHFVPTFAQAIPSPKLGELNLMTSPNSDALSEISSSQAFRSPNRELQSKSTSKDALNPERRMKIHDLMDATEGFGVTGSERKRWEKRGGAIFTESSFHSQRKARRCWSPDLHHKFVDALHQLGGAHVATPKQIRELMRVDGLTNDEVKSHLQKYRLHTRRPEPVPQLNPNLPMPEKTSGGNIYKPRTLSIQPDGTYRSSDSPEDMELTDHFSRFQNYLSSFDLSGQTQYPMFFQPIFLNTEPPRTSGLQVLRNNLERRVRDNAIQSEKNQIQSKASDESKEFKHQQSQPGQGQGQSQSQGQARSKSGMASDRDEDRYRRAIQPQNQNRGSQSQSQDQSNQEDEDR